MQRRQLLTMTALALGASARAADTPAAPAVTLAEVFGDHMVLQRDEPITVWGRGEPGASLRVALAGRESEARVGADGRWQARLPALPAGGPHELLVQGRGAAVRRADVWLGDVWLCGGQSNMAWPLEQADGGPQQVAEVDAPLIRHLRVPERALLRPAEDIAPAAWTVARRGASGGFSAVAWFFARRMQADPSLAQVPIGLVNVAWNGSHLETWTRREAALADPDLAPAVRALPADEAAFAAAQRQRVAAVIDRFQPGLPWPVAEGPAWAQPEHDDSAWPTLAAPGQWEGQGLPGVDGVVWLRKSIELTPAQAAGTALLHLAMVDDCDDSYVNGQRVGGLCQYDAPRRYALPAGLLRPGRNLIAVRVNDTGGGGGFHGDAATLRLDTAAGSVALAGRWKARVALPQFSGAPTANDAPTLAYNGLVHPLTRLKLRGVLWYQGESNVGRAEAYAGAFQRLITDWRAQFGQPALPFLFVQLAAFLPLAKNSLDSSAWAELRDAQRQTLALPHTAMAVATDVGDADDIHPRDKRSVGERLARQALHLADPSRPAAHGPRLQRVERFGATLLLQFDAAGLATRPAGAPLAGFAVAGATGPFVAATARIEGNRVVLSSPEVPAPEFARYGWVDNPSQANLVDGAGLPATPFRTDRRPLATAGQRYAP